MSCGTFDKAGMSLFNFRSDGKMLLGVGPPAVAAPRERLSRRASLGLREHPRGQLLLARPAGMRHHEAAGAVEHQTSPSAAPPALLSPAPSPREPPLPTANRAVSRRRPSADEGPEFVDL